MQTSPTVETREVAARWRCDHGHDSDGGGEEGGRRRTSSWRFMVMLAFRSLRNFHRTTSVNLTIGKYVDVPTVCTPLQHGVHVAPVFRAKIFLLVYECIALHIHFEFLQWALIVLQR